MSIEAEPHQLQQVVTGCLESCTQHPGMRHCARDVILACPHPVTQTSRSTQQLVSQCLLQGFLIMLTVDLARVLVSLVHISKSSLKVSLCVK